MKLVAISTLIFLLIGCGRNIQNSAAVQRGVVEHLKTRAGLNMDAMDVDVLKVSFRKDEADATVSIRVKGATDNKNSMTMSYTLERKGDLWVVKARDNKGSSPHGGTMPGGGMPGQELPPGHPSTEAPKAPEGAKP